jgi:hypothetical protein
MAFTMESIQKGIVEKPRKLVIYGPPKLGKSTLAGSTKNSLMIPTEDRVSHIDCDKTPVVKKYDEILEIFDFILNGKHKYKRIIIDTLDWLEPIIHHNICEKNNFKSLTDDHNKETAFAKGLKYHAVDGWKKFLHNCDVLRDNGIATIFIAHSHSITVNPPISDSYDKEVMKIDKNALSVIEEWADIIGFYEKEIYVKKDDSGINKKGKALPTNSRKLYLSGSNPAMISGNSFGLGDIQVELEHCSKIMEWLLTETITNAKEKPKEK